MPYDLNGGTAVPTFATPSVINASINSPYLNEADEMQLYQGSPYDSPFGPNDLEWLYRKQDSDGQYLQSRLSSLAPISFTNGVDDLRRRRLFALDAWETTNFVWAYDNPGGLGPNGAFPGNNRFGYGTPPNQTMPLPASFQALSYCAPISVTAGSQPIQTNGQIIQTPPLAHRDRKIDLNYPLPLSNNPDEPVRQKWIDNAYDFLKYALPPGATDTPQELSQLSQYLINVIDFRDPDATCTHYRNPDLFLRPAPAGALNQPATLMSYATASPPFNSSTDHYLDQYGMEYSPVAINEVLAYSFLRKCQGLHQLDRELGRISDQPLLCRAGQYADRIGGHGRSTARRAQHIPERQLQPQHAGAQQLGDGGHLGRPDQPPRPNDRATADARQRRVSDDRPDRHLRADPAGLDDVHE